MNPIPNGSKFDDCVIMNHRGDGNFGSVYAVSNSSFSTNIALKVCNATSDEEKKRFARENETLHILHPHERVIAPHSKIKTHNNTLYYLMELADCSLTKYLIQHDPVSEQEKLIIFKRICEGIQHAHNKKIIHRDLWWDNVLMKKDNSEYIPKINDFGRARDFSKQDPNYKERKVWGINLIRPPEYHFVIWNNSPDKDDYIPGDIYALGVLLYYIFNGLPSVPHTIVEDSINLFGKYISSGSIKYNSNEEYYNAWLAWIAPQQLEKHLLVILNNPKYNTEVNELILNLANFDYKKRYTDTVEIIKKLNTFI